MRALRVIPMLVTTVSLSAGALVAQRGACDDLRNDEGRAKACDVRVLGGKGLRALTIDPGTNGGAEVEAWDRDSIAVRAKVVSYARTEEGAAAIGREVKVTFANGVLSAEGPAGGRREGWAVMFEVRVPRKIDLDVETTNGPIEVAGVNGKLVLDAQNGPITLTEVGGEVRARLQNGPLTIALEGDHWEGTGLDASTVNGPLTLRIPEGYNAQLETGTRNGPFNTEIPITVQGRIGGHMGQQISTKLGRGGATIRANTTNGPLSIRSR
jgi:hypothetical protein